MKQEKINMTMQIENETVGVVMDEETKKAIIEDNYHVVPRNKRRQFDGLSLDEKIAKIQFYQDRQEKINEWKLKSSIEYKVKSLFETRHATVDDAKNVIEFAKSFIDEYREREIAKIDEEIARLEEMKQSL